jgi:hypothetical protein
MVMSALHLKADMCGANRHVCFGPKADIQETTCGKQKDRLEAVFPKFDQVLWRLRLFDLRRPKEHRDASG